MRKTHELAITSPDKVQISSYFEQLDHEPPHPEPESTQLF